MRNSRIGRTDPREVGDGAGPVTALHRLRPSFAAALAVSLAIAVFAVAAAAMEADRQQHSGRRQFAGRAALVTAAVSSQIDRYEAALTLVAAGLGGNARPTAASFGAVTAPLAALGLPGATAVALVVPAGHAAVAATQQDWRRRGAPGLTLRPSGAGRDHYFVVVNRSLDGTAAPTAGGDLSRSSEAAAAMDTARGSGRTTASAAYLLLQDRRLPRARRQLSFLLVAPVHAAGRPALLGWAVLGLRGQDFIGTVLRQMSQKLVDVALRSRTAAGPVTVASMTSGDTGRPDLRTTVPLNPVGWNLVITARAARLPGVASRLPLGIGLVGVLIAGFVFVLATGRARADRRLVVATAGLRAQQADLDAFAGVVAHDLRAPLAAITGFAHLAVRHTDEQAAGHLRQIIGAAARMDRLIADLLHFASAREARLELTDIDLRTLADEVVQARRSQTTADPASPPAEITIGALPRVRADAAMIRQLLDNLVGNSFKYTPPNRPVQIEITAEPAAGGWASITVADRGIGIPPGEHDAVFTGFHRAHPTVHPPGSGLGLTICRRITDRHAGKIKATQNPQGGTRITFTLPTP